MEEVNFVNNREIISSNPVDNTNQSQGNKPPEKEDESALHSFMYMVSFLSLLFVTTGLGTILFQLIDKSFPAETSGLARVTSTFAQSAVKFGLSALIIATPIFYVLSFLIVRYLFQGKILENSKARKSITYIILFLASIIILVNLIFLVYNWLGGGIVARFTLKIITLLTISASVFGYYFWDMRKKNIVGVKYMGNKIAGIASILVIITVFVFSFFIVDSPAETRNKLDDTKTISAMQSLKSSVERYYTKNNFLPTDLTELNNSTDLPGGISINNNSNSSRVTYTKTSDIGYQLCADFKTSNLLGEKTNPFGSSSDEWKHEKGNKCFDKEVKEKISSTKSNVNQVPPPPTDNPAVSTKLKAKINGLFIATQGFAINCRKQNGTIRSGSGGESLCSSIQTFKWPPIAECGSRPADTQWTVFDGENNNWTITLTCKENNICNGQNTAICDREKCKFQGTCGEQ